MEQDKYLIHLLAKARNLLAAQEDRAVTYELTGAVSEDSIEADIRLDMAAESFIKSCSEICHEDVSQDDINRYIRVLRR